jgi:hypothetical protein
LWKSFNSLISRAIRVVYVVGVGVKTGLDPLLERGGKNRPKTPQHLSAAQPWPLLWKTPK